MQTTQKMVGVQVEGVVLEEVACHMLFQIGIVLLATIGHIGYNFLGQPLVEFIDALLQLLCVKLPRPIPAAFFQIFIAILGLFGFILRLDQLL